MNTVSRLDFRYPHEAPYYLARAARFERWADHFRDNEGLCACFLKQAAKARTIAEEIAGHQLGPASGT